MALLNKLLVAATASAAALFTLVTMGTAPAQAALFKFSFEGDGANGYFIYDDTVQANDPPRATIDPASSIGEYDDSIKDYYLNLGGDNVYQGDIADSIVYLRRGPDALTPAEQADPVDDFIFFIPADSDPNDQISGNSLSLIFMYPEGSFGSSIEQLESVPNTATALLYPNVDFGTGLGSREYEGTVRTRIEKVPEPASLSALLGVGAWFVLRRRQRRQAQLTHG